MKKLFLIACMVISPLLQLSAQEGAKIVIIRDSGVQNFIFGFSTFVNDSYAEKIQNKTTTTLEVPTGEIRLSFRYLGKNKPWKHAKKLTLDLKPGETKYVMVTQKQEIFQSLIIPLEVTEATAKQYVQPLNFTVVVTLNK
jgi:hypothetical protein